MPDPSVSVVIPTYNVARYLPEFLNSLDAQQAGLTGFELIFVDDGSPDDSAEIIQGWIARSGAPARVVSKPNGGLSSARNAGLEVASGEWVTFWDPDDILGKQFTAEILPFLRSPEAADVQLVAARLRFYDDLTRTTRAHPLDYRFGGGNRIVDLTREPQLIHLAANTGFYRRALLDQYGLRFDDRVVPTFEDGHLTSRYLGKFPRPQIAFRANAVYLYRRRGDATSLVQTGWSKETKFRNQPRYGWLDLLRQTAADRGTAPVWAQNVVLYELQWYFKAQRQLPIRTGWVPEELAAEFHDTLAQVMAHIDAATVDGFGIPAGRLHPDLVTALVIGVKGQRRRPAFVTVDRLDTHRRMMRARYYYGGDLPAEEFRVQGQRVVPRHAKTRRIPLVGRSLAHERIAWFSATDALSVLLDGEPVPILIAPVGNDRYQAGPAKVWPELAGRQPPGERGAGRHARPVTERAVRVGGKVARAARDVRNGVPDTAARVRSKVLRPVRHRLERARIEHHATRGRTKNAFAKAWLLIDRDTHAQDNAEHLFRYLREHRPEVNAWFVLNRDSVDWDRLAAEGFRLLEHGSMRHKVALLNARHVISSQVDAYIITPLPPKRFGPPGWSFTFLQHGVIKDDLSVWLNPKPMDLMLTTTEDEHASIVGDDTAYTFTTKEIVRTGLPRHDRLWRLNAESSTPRDTVLVLPTWRLSLLGDRTAGGNDRELRQDFWETPYARAWQEVLESRRLHKAAAAAGLRIVFVPHPNMQGYVASSPLPPEVEVRRFADVDIQALLTSSAAVLTDYSSLAFDAAFIGRPVVYYQFDQAEFAASTHVYTPGNWDYLEQGFGPVLTDADACVDALVTLLDSGAAADPRYARRAEDTFDLRDGRCCERAYEAIRSLRQVPAPEELYVEAETP